MFLPPAAAWTVDSAPWQQRALAAVGLLGALAGLFFCLSQGWGSSSFLLAALLGICTAAAGLSLSGAAHGQLRWDGERWHWSSADEQAVSQLECVLDLQRFMLLRIACESGLSLWLWLYSPAMDARWLALRRAVVASQQRALLAPGDSLPK